MPVDIGQKAKEAFTLVTKNEPPSFIAEDCVVTRSECNYLQQVYANDSGVDYENDKSSVLGMFENWTSDVDFVLQKLEGGDYVDKATILDDTYGEYYPQGAFVSKPKYAGVVIYWASVLAAFSTGLYRIKVVEVNPLNPDGLEKFSYPFCLKIYGCAPDNTIRLEWYNNRKIGAIEDDRKVLDYSNLNWYSQYRLPMSIFGYPKSEYEVEEVQYPNGEFEHVKIIQKETYILKLGELPSYLHDIIKTYALMSGSLEVTDYSSNNPALIVKKAVKIKSGYEPRWSPSGKCAPVTLELEPRFNNLETFRC